MKKLAYFLNERLIINKDFKEYIIKCTNDDVYNIVLAEVKKQAKRPQRESRPIDLNHIDVSEVTSMSCLFDTVNDVLLHDEGIHLKYIDISGWDVSNVEEMKWMFADCKSLVSVGNLSNWKLNSIRATDGMFKNCIKLEYIGDISNWHVEDILDSGFEEMFKGCVRLKGNVGNLLKWNITPRALLNLKHQGMI